MGIDIDEKEKVTVECIATGGNLAPEFKWLIGNKSLTGTFESSEENEIVTYKSAMSFSPKIEQNEEKLSCEVIHKGYAKNQLKAGINVITAELDLHFMTKFSEPKEENNMIIFDFQSNPKPLRGQFIVEDSILPLNFQNLTFSSSNITKIDGKNMYEVQLNHSLYETRMVRLEIENSLGTVLSAEFEIGSSNNPTVLIVTIVPLLILLTILVYLAKKKEILCFSRKDSQLYLDAEAAEAFSKTPLIADDQKISAQDKTDGSVKISDSVTDENDYKTPSNSIKSNKQNTSPERPKNENSIELDSLLPQEKSDSKTDLKSIENEDTKKT